MPTIYRKTDKIKVQIDDISIKVTPLSYSEKMEINELMSKALTEKKMKYAMDGTILAIKYSLKAITGLETPDGESYQLEMDNKQVTDDCINDLLNMKYSQKLAAVCASLVHGVGHEIVDPQTQEKIDGISFEVGDEKKS